MKRSKTEAGVEDVSPLGGWGRQDPGPNWSRTAPPAEGRIDKAKGEWLGSMAARLALTIAFLFFIIALFAVGALTTAGSALLGAFLLISVGILAGLGLILVTRSVRVELVPDAKVGRLQDLQQLRRLAAHYRLSRFGNAQDLRRRIASYHWRERRIEGVVAQDEEHLGRALVERLVPQPTPTTPGESNRANRRRLRPLLDEASDLRILAYLLKVDVRPYSVLAAKATKMAESGGMRECVLIVQLANERLRAALEAEITKHPELARAPTAIAIR